jgi:tetratricopeptide (TPR) repeat protein
LGRAARRAERVQKPEPEVAPARALPPWAKIVTAAAVLGHGIVGYASLPRPIFDKYPVVATGFVAGHGGILPSDVSPLYLVLHLLLLPDSGVLVRALQVLIGIAGAWAVASLAARFDGTRGALVAGIAYAFAAPLVLYEATLEPDSLLASFVILSLAATAAEAPIVGGLFSGLAVALRPTTLLFALLQGAWLARSGARRAFLRYAAAFLVAAAIPMGLVKLRLGGSTLAVMSFGQVLQQGNAPAGVGVGGQYLPLVKPLEAQENRAGTGGADWAHEAYRQLAAAEAGRPLDAFASELVWARKVVAFVRRHPLAWLRIEGLKSKLVFGPFELHDITDLVAYSQGLFLIPAAVFYPLGGAGLVWMLVRGRGRIVFAAAAALAVPLLLFAVTARYRIVWAPLVAVGMGAVADLAVTLREQRLRSRAAWLAVALALVLVVPPAAHRYAMRAMDRGIEASGAYFQGDRARRHGQVAEARASMQKALGLQPVGLDALDLRGIPWDEPAFWEQVRPLVEGAGAPHRAPAAEFDAGVVDRHAGRLDEALQHFRNAEAGGFYLDYNDGGDPSYEAGLLLLRMGRLAEARAALSRSQALRPGALRTLVALEAAARDSGDEAAARAVHEEIEALHDRISASYERACFYRTLGRWSEAHDALQPALTAFGRSALVRWEEALAALGLGDRAAALAAYRTCLDLLPSYPFESAPFDVAVFAAQRESPQDLGLLRLAGDHAMRRGLFADAARLWREALARTPELRSDPAIKGQLEYAERAAGVTVP